MGFSQIVGQLAFIFIFLIMVAFLFNSYRTYFETGSEDSAALHEALDNKLKTNMDIIGSGYSFGYTTLTLENTGSTTLDPEQLDVFYGGAKVSRDSTTYVLLDTSYDPLYWNPTEHINLTVPVFVFSDVLFRVSNQYGSSAYEVVSP